MSKSNKLPHLHTIQQLRQGKNKHKLKCGKCGAVGRFDLGVVLIDPEIVRRVPRNEGVSRKALWDAASFTGYFHCRKCGAGGPWKPTDDVMGFLLICGVTLFEGFEDGPIQFGQLRTFDGKTFRCATDAAQHLEALIANDPGNAILHNRLGNILRGGGRPDLAKKQFLKAVELDDKGIEAHFSLGQILYEEDKLTAAVEHYTKFVDHVRQRKDLPLDLRIDLLQNAMDDMIEIHGKSRGTIPIASGRAIDELRRKSPDKPRLLEIREYSPNKPTDWTEFLALILDENTTEVHGHLKKREIEIARMMEEEETENDLLPVKPGDTTPQKMLPSDTPKIMKEETGDYIEDDGKPAIPLRVTSRVGRNDPCPCGSGKKYKKCCGVRA